MALEKVIEVDKIEVVGEYSIQVRQATKVLDDGVQIGGVSYHRHVVHPNSNWSNDDAKVKKIADSLFDDDCKEAWQLSQYGYPSGDPSDSWELAQLQKYCDSRRIEHYPEAVEAVEAQDAVLDEDGEEVSPAVEAVEAQDADTKSSLLAAIEEASDE
jgi:hypothetical protein